MDRQTSDSQMTNVVELRRKHVRQFYEQASTAHKQGIPLVWICAGSHDEVIHSVGAFPTFRPASQAAVAARRGTSLHYCDVAHEHGYSSDLCSYVRNIIGMVFDGKDPYGPIPRPDLIIIDSAICDAVCKGWEPIAAYYGVPTFRVESQIRFIDNPQKYIMEWKVAELMDEVRFLETNIGGKFEFDRLKALMALEARTCELIGKIQEYRKHIPCPVDPNEMSSSVFYQANLPATEMAFEYFTAFLKAVEQNTRQGKGAATEERYRLLYDGIPIWYDLDLYEYLKERGAVIVWETYSNLEWMGYYFDGIRINPSKPLESLAMKYFYGHNYVSLRVNLERFRRAVAEWKCDGVIQLHNKSCKVYDLGSVMKARMFRELGVPTLVIDADHCDPSGYDPGFTRNMIDSFLEILEGKKGNK